MDKELEDLKTELASVKAKLAVLETENAQAAVSVQEKEKVLATLNSELSSVKAELVGVKAEKLDLMGKLAESKAACDKMMKEGKNMKRKAALIEAGIEESEIEETLAKLDDLTDETFDFTVSKWMGFQKKGKPEEKKEEKKDKGKAEEEEKAAALAKAEKEKAEKAAADLKALEEAEAKEKANMTEEIEAPEVVARVKSMASWLESCVFKSTANIKEEKEDNKE